MVERDYMRRGWDGGFGGGVALGAPRLTPGVKALLLANLAGFVLIFAAPGPIVSWLGLNPARPWAFPLQAFTYQFLHDAADLRHLAFNMLALYFFGTSVEGWIGTRRFLRLYLGCGVGAAACFLLYSLLQPAHSCIGASGAVSGVVVYFCCVQPMATVILLFIPVRAWVLGAGWLTYAAYSLLVEIRFGHSSQVAHSAHLGGALAGLGWWRFQGSLERWTGVWTRRLEERRRQKALRDRARMDELLSQVSREGLPSLSGRDRRFLQAMSKRLKRR